MSLTWREQSHTHIAELGTPILALSVWWDAAVRQDYKGPRYCASVFGARFKRKFETLDKAKMAAEREGRRLLDVANTALAAKQPSTPDLDSQPKP